MPASGLMEMSALVATWMTRITGLVAWSVIGIVLLAGITIAATGVSVAQDGDGTAAPISEANETVSEEDIDGNVTVVNRGESVSVDDVEDVSAVEPTVYIGPNVTDGPDVSSTADGVQINVTQEYVISGVTAGWQGAAPATIAGTSNPTLSLAGGQLYAISWVNSDGLAHNVAITNENGTNVAETPIISGQGGSQTLVFRVPEKAGTYYCVVHPVSMRGNMTANESGTAVGADGNTTATENETDADGVRGNQTEVTPPEVTMEDNETDNETESPDPDARGNQTEVTPPEVTFDNETATDANDTRIANVTARDLQARSVEMQNVTLSNVTVTVNQTDSDRQILIEALTVAISDDFNGFDPGDVEFGEIRSATIDGESGEVTVSAKINSTTLEHITAEQVAFNESQNDIARLFESEHVIAETTTVTDLQVETFSIDRLPEEAAPSAETTENETTDQDDTSTQNESSA